jgi:PAS domain S-box-containing protein
MMQLSANSYAGRALPLIDDLMLELTTQVNSQAGNTSPPNGEAAIHQQINRTAPELEAETTQNRFFNLSVDMLAVADFSGNLRRLNPSWERTLGHKPEDLQNKSLLLLIHPDDQTGLLHQIQHLEQRSTTTYFEGRCSRKDGSYRWLGWTATSVPAEKAIYIFARDITLRKLAEQEVQKLNTALANRASELERANVELQREMEVRKKTEAALKDTNAELEAFAYSVSHDLRAPLRAMQGFAHALLEDCAEELGSTGAEYAQRVVSAANRMDNLIQDLLLYSRISHTTIQLEPVSLDWAVGAALAQLEAPLRDSGAKVEILNKPIKVVGHKATLVQVIGNLLSNAFKFVKPGVQPLVRICFEPNGQMARLWVIDNGIGIPAEFQARVFRVFERLHGIETYPGTGIGLAIVRKGLERMGGRVGLQSGQDQGSSFWIELPVAAN